eukprot:ANDGO_07117.mRNA.1 hypothetical protein
MLSSGSNPASAPASHLESETVTVAASSDHAASSNSSTVGSDRGPLHRLNGSQRCRTVSFSPAVNPELMNSSSTCVTEMRGNGKEAVGSSASSGHANQHLSRTHSRTMSTVSSTVDIMESREVRKTQKTSWFTTDEEGRRVFAGTTYWDWLGIMLLLFLFYVLLAGIWAALLAISSAVQQNEDRYD